MTVCKYMSSRWGLDYLSNWHLKITPPHEFNDPFELKTPAPEIFSEEYFSKQFDDNVEAYALEDFAKKIREESKQTFSESLSAQMAIAFVDGPNSLTYKRLVKKLRKYPKFSEKVLRGYAEKGHRMWPILMENARLAHAGIRPSVNQALERGLADKVPSMLGVLCLSKNLNQPLMWSHYAQSHQGLMIEFDASHSALNKRRSEKDDFGFLRDVVYSERRPTLNIDALNDGRGFQTFALTKSSHWSYEEEQRFVWPLEQCDKSEDGTVSLIALPPASVVSVTLGCRASEATEDQLLQTLAGQESCAHIVVRRARMHPKEFELVYERVDR